MRAAHCAADLEVTHGTSILAARQVLPAQAVLGGLSAALALGVDLTRLDDRVEVVLPHAARVRTRRQVRVRGDELGQGEVVDTRYGPATSPARRAFDLGRRGCPTRTVPQLDALMHETGVDPQAVLAVLAAHPGARGARLLVPALELVDPGAESVRESQVRLFVVDEGLPAPVTQYIVWDRQDRFVARVDLAWPEHGVALEYDGSYHDQPAQIASDRVRMNKLRACGWLVIVVDRHQFARRDELAELLRDVLSRRG